MERKRGAKVGDEVSVPIWDKRRGGYVYRKGIVTGFSIDDYGGIRWAAVKIGTLTYHFNTEDLMET